MRTESLGKWAKGSLGIKELQAGKTLKSEEKLASLAAWWADPEMSCMTQVLGPTLTAMVPCLPDP